MLINEYLNRITVSNYSNLGGRVNYYNLPIKIVLTKQQNCSKIRQVVNNSYVLGVL